MLSLLPLTTSVPILITEPIDFPKMIFIEGNSMVGRYLPETPKAEVLGAIIAINEGIELEFADLLNELADCESGSNPDIINWDDMGSPSFSILQFKEKTWQIFCEGEIMNKDDQFLCADKMLQEPDGWKHWYNCAIEIGLPNRLLDK